MIRASRRRLPALSLVLVLLAGCSGDLSLGIGGDDVDAELVAFANAGAGSTSQVAMLLDTREKAAGFADVFAGRHPRVAADLRARVVAVPPGPKRVLLGFGGLGCAEDGARLRRRGGDLVVEFTGGKGTVCAAASQLVAVFAVEPGALPTDGPLARPSP